MLLSDLIVNKKNRRGSPVLYRLISRFGGHPHRTLNLIGNAAVFFWPYCTVFEP